METEECMILGKYRQQVYNIAIKNFKTIIKVNVPIYIGKSF